MAPAAILDFWEVKFDVTESHGRPVSTSTPNFVKIAQRVTKKFRSCGGRSSPFPIDKA